MVKRINNETVNDTPDTSHYGGIFQCFWVEVTPTYQNSEHANTAAANSLSDLSDPRLLWACSPLALTHNA